MSERRKFSKAERAAVWAKYDGHCAYCGKEIPISKMQVDHMVSVMLGGTNESMNIFPSCRSCNNYKTFLSIEGFRKAIEHWCEVLMRDNVTYRNAVRFGQVIPAPHPVEFYFERIDRLRITKEAGDHAGENQGET